VRRALSELRVARTTRGVSLRTLSAELGLSKSQLDRIERATTRDVGVIRLAEIASLLGYELALTLHPVGDAIRDKGHEALLRRFRARLPAASRIAREVPFPNAGDPRHWDLIVRLGAQRVGVEAETRIRDMQELVRRMRGRERNGGVDEVVLVLSDSGHNRRLVAELRAALGPTYVTPPRALLGRLQRGEPLPGCGVILV
jgi:transcriptional regulator with XRE-family HTH domain